MDNGYALLLSFLCLLLGFFISLCITRTCKKKPKPLPHLRNESLLFPNQTNNHMNTNSTIRNPFIQPSSVLSTPFIQPSTSPALETPINATFPTAPVNTILPTSYTTSITSRDEHVNTTNMENTTTI